MNFDGFQIGDKVRLLDDPGEGIVIALSSQSITVEMDGMDFTYHPSEIVKVEHDDLIHQKASAADLSAKDKLSRIEGRNKLKNLEGGAREEIYEIDLHIHELLDHFHNMTNTEILQVQMSKCKQFVHEAIKNRYQKVILIHGVGEGVLRSEIHRWLDRQDHIEYHDAAYRTYGYGATEVIIHR